MKQRSDTFRSHSAYTQRGAALMIMLVIMVIGVIGIFVASLSSSALQNSRDRTTADALAKAKEALIAYAVSDSNRPGELPCPDVNDDGKLTLNVDYTGSNCTSPVGRLPWVTLGIPELRDGAGEHLWYAVSKTFWANGSAVLNSDAVGDLTITDIASGASTSQVIAIVFAAGAPLQTQGRSTAQTAACATTNTTVAQSLCATNYLEGSNASLNLNTSPNTSYQTAAASPTFNDQMLYITRDHLLQPVEMRIAREVKSCLDTYSAASAHKYPWAAPASNLAYPSTSNTLFGRIPVQPTISISSPLNPSNTSDTKILALFSAMTALNTAVNNCIASGSSSNETALAAAGAQLITAANSVVANQPTAPAISSTATNYAITAGTKAQSILSPSRCSRINSGTSTSVQTNLNSTYTTLGGITVNVPEDGSMQTAWPSGCFVPGSYWDNWKNLIFYQVANGYQPNGSVSCTPNTTCLTINGSGNMNSGSGSYRAAVVLAGKMLAGQTRSNPSVISGYLESSNLAGKTDMPTTTTFATYRPTDPTYSTVNDLVFCLDGRNNCK